MCVSKIRMRKSWVSIRSSSPPRYQTVSSNSTSRFSGPAAGSEASGRTLRNYLTRLSSPSAPPNVRVQLERPNGIMARDYESAARQLQRDVRPRHCQTIATRPSLRGKLPSRLIPHRHRPRVELQPAYELQVDKRR